MSRSVALPSNPSSVWYYGLTEDDYEDGSEFWGEFTTEIASALQHRFPSFAPPSKRTYMGDECRVILENEYGRVTVSDYLGCVAVCLVETECPTNYGAEFSRVMGLRERWLNRVSAAFMATLDRTFGKGLTPVGCMSNGGMLYRRTA